MRSGVWVAACAAVCVLTAAPAQADPLVGDGAVDSFGGYLPDGVALTAFDVTNPIIGRLDPALLAAVQQATRVAADEGIEMQINSGWRSRGFQERLFDDGVRTYGSVAAAEQFVATPDTSSHVTGRAVDVGPPVAQAWMSRNAPRFGLCQVFANELWHYELTAFSTASGQVVCPPMRPNAAG